MKSHHLSLICLLVLCFGFEFQAYAAKKDFTGIFGSYRREKFTENEGNKTDFSSAEVHCDVIIDDLLFCLNSFKTQNI